MKKRLFHCTLAISLGLALAALLLWLHAAKMVQADPAGTRCVAPGGAGGCYSSIQAAVNAANDEDTIQVAQGTYHETVVITKSVALEGGWNSDFTARDWDIYVTTIDAQRADSVIRVEGTVSPTIEGFIITGGDASSSGLGWGGGILVYYSGLEHGGTTVIRHNVITDNVACRLSTCQGEGGGVMVYQSGAIIEYNTVISNVARKGGDGGGKGGGIRIGWSSEATLIGNTIVNNTAVFSPTGLWEGKGGGVCLYGSSVTLTDNEIQGNVAAVNGTGRGGGVYATGDLYDNHILGNTASINGTGYGGGVYADWVQDFSNNLLQGNVASRHGDGTGGGIYAVQLQHAACNTIVGNTATRGGGLYLGEYSNTEMRGNLIAHNQATGVDLWDGGGGIASVDDDAEIINNDVLSNTARLGGGLLVAGGDQYKVQENSIAWNTAENGGGAFVYSATGTIAENWIVGNTAITRGGGIYVSLFATATLDANHILSNTAVAGEGGAVAIRFDSSPVTLTNHIIAHNNAALGGGVHLHAASDVRFVNNTVANERANSQQGVELTNNSLLTMSNNIVVGHSVAVTVSAGSTATLSYNDYWDNTIGVAGQLSGTTDMTLNPQFEDRAANDYHLALTSPLIDAGDSTVNVDHDFEGDPRPHDGGIDVGADEAYRAESYVSDATGSDITGDGSPSVPFATVTKALSETRTSGTIYVGRGHYTERITVTRSVNLLGGYREGDWSRDIAVYATTLDAAGTGTVVVIQGEGTEATVEGFTITGGETNGSGGGLIVHEKAAAAIRHNTITGNHAKNGGGGLLVWGNENADSVIDSNRIYDNVAEGTSVLAPLAAGGLLHPRQGPETGGGLLVSGQAGVVNNMIYGNTCPAGGDGMALCGWSGPLQVYHNTVADNGGDDGVGVELVGATLEISFCNNLIVGHGTGITSTSGAQGAWDYNGFYDNAVAYAPGLTGGDHDVSGDPYFVDRTGGNYHLNFASVMAGRGMDAGVSTDIDGDPRPSPDGTLPDLGADEINQHRVFLPLVVR